MENKVINLDDFGYIGLASDVAEELREIIIHNVGNTDNLDELETQITNINVLKRLLTMKNDVLVKLEYDYSCNPHLYYYTDNKIY